MSRIRDWRPWLLGDFSPGDCAGPDHKGLGEPPHHRRRRDHGDSARVSHLACGELGCGVQHVHQPAQSRADALDADGVFAAGGGSGADRAWYAWGASCRLPPFPWRWCWAARSGTYGTGFATAWWWIFSRCTSSITTGRTSTLQIQRLSIGGILLLLDSLLSPVPASNKPEQTTAQGDSTRA